MKVKPSLNSGNPAPVQSEANIKDGTSNTLQIAERRKTENPFAKDSFESSPKRACDASAKDAAFLTVKAQTPRGEASGLKADSNEVAMEGLTARGEASGLKFDNEVVDAVDLNGDLAGKTGEEKNVVSSLNVKYTMFSNDE